MKLHISQKKEVIIEFSTDVSLRNFACFAWFDAIQPVSNFNSIATFNTDLVWFIDIDVEFEGVIINSIIIVERRL